jgi:hypothetical protein
MKPQITQISQKKNLCNLCNLWFHILLFVKNLEIPGRNLEYPVFLC